MGGIRHATPLDRARRHGPGNAGRCARRGRFRLANGRNARQRGAGDLGKGPADQGGAGAHSRAHAVPGQRTSEARRADDAGRRGEAFQWECHCQQGHPPHPGRELDH